MLILTRKIGERITIGDNVHITVTDIDRDRVRLGIEAPRGVPIYRQELLTVKQAAAEANRLAATHGGEGGGA